MKNEKGAPVDGAFLRALQEHRQGETLTELSVGMRTAVEAALTCGKPAKLTLEVTFTPNGPALALVAEVKTKVPKIAPYAGIFFADDAHNLFRNDPKQPELPPLRTVEAESQQQAESLRKVVGE